MIQPVTRSLMDIKPRELKEIVRDLPTLPVVFQELFKMMRDPDIQVPVLAEFIARDQALTAKILKLVNSAFYGRPSQITTISRAVVIMGFQAVRSAALAIGVFEHFKGVASVEAFDLRRFWQHNIACGCIAKEISRTLTTANPEDAFVVGLLHDVGKLVMLRYFPDDVEQLCRAAAENELTWLACEDALFPIGHATVARAVFRSWDFPDTVVEAVACHHLPQKASRHAELTAVCHVADYLAHAAGWPCPGARAPRQCASDAIRLLGLRQEMVAELMDSAREEIRKSESILQLLD